MSEEETESEEFEDDLDEDFLDDIEEKPSRKKLVVLLFLLLVIVGGGYVAFTNFMPAGQSDDFQVSNVPEKRVPPPEPELSDEAVDQHPPVLEEEAQQAITEEEIPASQPTAAPVDEPVVAVFEEPVSTPSQNGKKQDLYTVQVGTYVQKESVDKAKKILKKLGMDYAVTTATTQLDFNQVLVGEFQHPDEVRDMVNKFFSEDIKVKFKILSEDGLYTLSIMSGFDKRKAEITKKDLILKGYPARIRATKQDVEVYVVKTGKFNGREEAEVVYNKLLEKRIQPLIRKVR